MATRAFRTLDDKVIPFDDQLIDPAALEAMGATLVPSFQVPEQAGKLADASSLMSEEGPLASQQPPPRATDIAGVGGTGPGTVEPMPEQQGPGTAVTRSEGAGGAPGTEPSEWGKLAQTNPQEALKQLNAEVAAEQPKPPPPPKPRPVAGGGQPAKDPLQEEQERILEDAAQLRLDQRLLIQQRQDADMELAKVQVAQQQEQARQAAEEVARAKAMREEIEREADRLQQEVRDTAREASEQRVDPRRYWNSRSNFARAIGALALVIGARNPQGDNVAKKMMDDAIDRDIKEQEFAAEQAWAKNRAAKSQFVDYLETYGSPKAARENLKSVMYAQLAHERQAQLMNAGLDRQAVENDSIFKQLSLEQQNRELMGRQETVNAIQQRRILDQQARTARTEEVDPAKRVRVVTDPETGNQIGMVLGKSGDVIQAQMDGLHSVQRALKRMKALSDKTSPTYRAIAPGNEAYRQWNAQRTEAMIGMKNLYELGVIAGADMELMEGQVPTAKDYNPKASIDETLKIFEDKKRKLEQRIITGDTLDLPQYRGPTPGGVEEVK